MALTKIGESPPPWSGLRRLLYRLPLPLYRLGLGWLLGQRFLLLTHTGRNTGLQRQTVLEVLRHDRRSDRYIIASAWGERAQWYRNLLAHPQVRITVGRRRTSAVAHPLPQADADREMLDYGGRNPAAARFVARLIGYRIDGTEEDLRALAARVPLLALRVT